MDETVFRPGLEGVVASETAISTITDGLRYRGYAIEELAEHATFEEVAYLILYGELPSRPQDAAFRQRLADAAVIDKTILDALRHIPRDVPMMDVMRSGCSLLSHWDPDASDNSRNANLHKSERLLGQLPIVLAARHRLRTGRDPIAPTSGQSLAANVLWMVTGQPPSEQHVRAMDASLILYAEHELNASTFTARVVCSTMSDLHSSVTAAIGALKGPLHGGANERVMGVLAEAGSADGAEAWVRNALARKVRIMGFGHRVYKAGDPRARFLKPYCTRLAAQTNNQEMENMADCIERIVVAEKKLPPNLDWPSARLYHYMGLPIDLYTPLFVVSRVVGWCAHVIEQLDHNRLIRPRSNYIGPAPRAFVPLDQRNGTAAVT